MTSFSLITLSYQSGTHTQRCLEALQAQGATEIIHADNGSSDIDLPFLRARFPAVLQVNNGENLGFAEGMNRAAATANGDWLGFINPDAFVESHWLDAMRAAIEAWPDTHIFTALQLDADDPRRMDGAGDALTGFGFPYRAGYGQPVSGELQLAEVFAPCGAAFVIRRELFEALGGFDERFFCYCEDADLGFRARLRGERTLFVPEAIVHHVGSASLGVRSDFALWHGYRNRFWLFVKNMPLVLLIATLPLHIGMTLLMAIKDTLKGKASIVWPALWAGLKGLRPILANRKLIQKTRQISAFTTGEKLDMESLQNRPPRSRSQETDMTALDALKLQASADAKVSIVEQFAIDPQRLSRMSVEVADILVDLSKQSWTKTGFEAAIAAFSASGLIEAREKMWTGKAINVSENRAVLHVALRDSMQKTCACAELR